MSKVVCMGECLVDLVPEGGKYVAKAGGAPANVCACVSKLSGESYYLGKLGNDEYADFLYNALVEAGVNTQLVKRDNFKTAVAKVTLDENGDRQFSFSRDNTADLNLYADEIDDNLFKKDDILHFCSVCLVDSPVKDAHIKAIKLAKKSGAIISFDVNLRNALFGDDVKLFNVVREFTQYADILKFTDDELSFVTGTKDERKGVCDILKISNAKNIIITKGSSGACLYDRDLNSISIGAYDTKVVDTTGAGDAFIGSFLYNVLKNGLKEHAKENMKYLEFSTKASAVVIGRFGALLSMPTIQEIENL